MNMCKPMTRGSLYPTPSSYFSVLGDLNSIGMENGEQRNMNNNFREKRNLE